jgi:hypothetical protein
VPFIENKHMWLILPALAALKEAVLLAMLRTAARCESIPSDVVSSVETLAASAGRHIRFVSLLWDFRVM